MIKPIIIEENIDPTEWDKQLAYLKDKTGLSINNCINYKENSGLMQILRDSSTAINIILIDTEAKIVEGDLRINRDFGDKILNYIGSLESQCTNVFKIISSTNKSHGTINGFKLIYPETNTHEPIGEMLPQLSTQSIQLLINYYNEFRCMPERVEVEYIKYPGIGLESNNDLKLNQQGEADITIPEVGEKLYTEEEMCSNMQQYLDEYVFTNETYVTPQKWFNSKKK